MSKKPRLFYYEDAVDGYVPCDGSDLDTIISTECLEDNETIEIVFMRKDMTDKEYANIPEC